MFLHLSVILFTGGFSVQEGLCPGGSLSRGSLSRGGLFLEGLSSGGSLSGGSLSRGISVWGSLREVVSLEGSLSEGCLCPGGSWGGGLCLERFLSAGVSVQERSLLGGSLSGTPYGKERAVRILLECILVNLVRPIVEKIIGL